MSKQILPLHIINQMNDEHLRKAIYHLEAYLGSHAWDDAGYKIVKAEIEPVIGALRERLD
jgi:hypothetical protein